MPLNFEKSKNIYFLHIRRNFKGQLFAMRTIFNGLLTILISLLVFTSFNYPTQDTSTRLLTGAWSAGTPENQTIAIYSGNVFAIANYDITGKKFLSSYGGTWKVEGKQLIRKIEWNSMDSSTVGTEMRSDIKLSAKKLNIPSLKENFERMDDGTPGELAGAWIISGNFINDKASKRANPFYPRRTMKVLSGKYFHWIAYNVATKQFLNAGGGTYTTVNGKYTENIHFFTKTSESIGKSLEFNYSFIDGEWRHQGQKSTGGAMDECWTKREILEK